MTNFHGEFTIAVTDMIDLEPGLLFISIHPTNRDGETASFYMHSDGREESVDFTSTDDC